jgi:hypothetical protein
MRPLLLIKPSASRGRSQAVSPKGNRIGLRSCRNPHALIAVLVQGCVSCRWLGPSTLLIAQAEQERTAVAGLLPLLVLSTSVAEHRELFRNLGKHRCRREAMS